MMTEATMTTERTSRPHPRPKLKPGTRPVKIIEPETGLSDYIPKKRRRP